MQKVKVVIFSLLIVISSRLDLYPEETLQKECGHQMGACGLSGLPVRGVF